MKEEEICLLFQRMKASSNQVRMGETKEAETERQRERERKRERKEEEEEEEEINKKNNVKKENFLVFFCYKNIDIFLTKGEQS